MCWTDEASDACWEGVRVGFRAVGLLEQPPAPPLALAGAAPLRGLPPPGSAPAQAVLRR